MSNSAIFDASLGQIQRIARDLAPYLENGDLFELNGDLGSGKKYFIQGIGEGLHVKEFIKNPYYQVMRVLKGRLPLYHFDLYEIEEEQFIASGYQEHLFSPGVIIVESGNKIEEMLPEDRLRIEFYFYLSYFEGTKSKIRTLEIISSGKRSEDLSRKIDEIVKKLAIKRAA